MRDGQFGMGKRRAGAFAGLLLGILCLGALSACAGLGRVFERPRVELEGAEVEGIGLDRADLRFDFQVQNPNGVTLPLAGIDYELMVNGARLLAGRRDQRLDIAAHGASRVELPVSV